MPLGQRAVGLHVAVEHVGRVDETVGEVLGVPQHGAVGVHGHGGVGGARVGDGGHDGVGHRLFGRGFGRVEGEDALLVDEALVDLEE